MPNRNIQLTTGNLQQIKSAGFTLIELLVVISIISVMSSVVLASVKSARQKAQDTVSASVIREYQNVISQLRKDDGTFPYFGTGFGLDGVCVGKDAVCPLGGTHVPEIDAEVEYFLPSPPPIVDCNGGPKNGITYKCKPTSVPFCSQIFLYWCAQGDSNCEPNGTRFGPGPNSFCIRAPFP